MSSCRPCGSSNSWRHSILDPVIIQTCDQVRDTILPIIKQNVANDETVHRRRPQAASQQLDMLFSEERNEEAEQMLAKEAIDGEQGYDEADNLWFYIHREKTVCDLIISYHTQRNSCQMSKPGSNILRRIVISMYAGIIGITRDPAQFFGLPMDLVVSLDTSGLS